MTTRATASLCALLLALAGCKQQELRPLDPTPVAARDGLATRGGARLELDPDGTLVQRTPASDAQALLGVALEERAGGLVVLQRLDASAPFDPEDRLVAVYPTSIATVATPTVARVLERGHRVTRGAELAGYALAPALLHVVVERGGQLLLCSRPVGAAIPVPVRLHDPVRTRKLGYEAVAVGALPPDLRPIYPAGSEKLALDTDLLVTWVSVDSPLAHAGVRPLDLLRHTELPRRPILGSSRPPRRWIDVTRPDGTDELLFEEDFAPKETLEVWPLVDGERDAKRTEVQVALGFAYKDVNLRGYDRRSDDYWEAHASDIAWGTVTFVTIDGPPGTGELTYVNLTQLGLTPESSVDRSMDWNQPYFDHGVVVHQE